MIRFDGKVAIVTGAGRGLGRQYALDLAARGAKVLVNDVGGDLAAQEGHDAPAREVAEEITALGGEAIWDAGDIRSAAARSSIVAAAIDRWGHVDILINNAGIAGTGGDFGDVDPASTESVLAINLAGAMGLAQEVWPHMARQRYGRIVNVTSHSVFGTLQAVPYTSARAAHLAMTASLAVEGEALGIRINAIMPAAFTRMTAGIENPEFRALLETYFGPETVSPVVLALASEDVPCNGHAFHGGGGLAARAAIGFGRGATGLTSPEDVLAAFDEVDSLQDAVFPANVDAVMAHVFGRIFEAASEAPTLR